MWGAYALTGIVCLLFAGSLVVVVFRDDPSLLNLVVGAIIAQFSGIVQYWTGSSATAAQKDEEIDALTAKPP
jgi:hypothetical protein